MGGIVGSVVGSVASGLVGKALGGGKSKAQPTQQEQQHPGSFFQPFTFKSGLGSVTGTNQGDYGFNTESQLDPRLTTLQNLALGGTEGLLNKYMSSIDFDPRVLDFQYDPYKEADDYFNRGLDILNPQFEAQRTKLASDLFGSGRMGLSLAQSSLGAGEDASGFVNPDAYGLLSAQNNTLANLYNTSLDKGRQMQQERFNILSGLDAANRGRTQDYFGGLSSLFNLGTGINDIELALRKQALDEERLRSGSYSGNATTMNWQETPESKFASTVAGPIGQAVGGLFGGTPSTPGWGVYNGIGGTSLGNAIGYQGSIADTGSYSFDSNGWVNGMGG